MRQNLARPAPRLVPESAARKRLRVLARTLPAALLCGTIATSAAQAADFEEIALPEAVLADIELRALPETIAVAEDLQRLLIAGRDAVLDRRYADAAWYFDHAEHNHHASPVGPLGHMLIAQAQMLENYDMASEDEYRLARNQAQKRLQNALDAPGNEAWDHLLAGAFHGMEGLHAMRKNQYIASVRRGLGAVRHLRRSRRAGDRLHDVDLGLGGYDYFRSVVSRQAPWVPFVPDRREEGLALIEHARREGEFMRPIAQLALVFTLIDENRSEQSIALARAFLERYPNNVVARIQLGRALSRRRHFEEAIQEFEHVLELHPENRIVGYYLGHTLVHGTNDLSRAEAILQGFLKQAPDDHARGWGIELLGDIRRREGMTDEAIQLWRRAHRLDSRDTSAKRKVKRARAERRAKRSSTSSEQTTG